MAKPLEVRELTVMVGTDQPEALARFYGEVLGLPRVAEYKDPVFRAGGASLRIIRHSEAPGRNAQPGRHILNLFVDGDVGVEVERLRGLGVPVVREAERESWRGVVSTVEDPDGNYVQLIEER